MGRRGRRSRVVVVVAGLTAGAAAAACVLVDPPAEIPVPPVQHPVIERELCAPPVSQILETWPTEFDVAIQAFDSTSTVNWQAFLDFDVTGLPIAQGQIDGDPTRDSGLRLLNVRLPTPATLQDCHVVEILVARSTDVTGGDSVTWFYSPGGSLDGCPVFDAGAGDAGAGDAEGGGG